jgi:DNA-binding MarR family transcriptional regulator
MVATPRAQSVEPEDVSRLLIEALHRLQAAEPGETLSIMNASGLTMPQVIALHVLKGRPMAVGAIAAHVKLSPAATSHLVERLVGQGLVERCERAEDRRQKQVSLSRRGTALIERLNRARMAALSLGVARLPLRTRTELGRVLADCLTALPTPVTRCVLDPREPARGPGSTESPRSEGRRGAAAKPRAPRPNQGRRAGGPTEGSL